MKKNELVWSRDESSGETQLKPIAQTFEKYSTTLALTFDKGETIETTSEHPFYVVGRGFVQAGELGIGTSIVTRAGPSVALVAATAGAAQTVYNFEVADYHTYFVGQGEVWVHNADCDGLLEPLDKTPYPKHPTSKPLSPGLEPGEYVYVMDANGVVHIAQNGPHMHPKVLGNGQSAKGAGTLKIGPDGTITEVTNYSGTFQPDPNTIPNVITAITGQGVNVAPGAGRGMNFTTGAMWP